MGGKEKQEGNPEIKEVNVKKKKTRNRREGEVEERNKRSKQMRCKNNKLANRIRT